MKNVINPVQRRYFSKLCCKKNLKIVGNIFCIQKQHPLHRFFKRKITTAVCSVICLHTSQKRDKKYFNQKQSNQQTINSNYQCKRIQFKSNNQTLNFLNIVASKIILNLFILFLLLQKNYYSLWTQLHIDTRKTMKAIYSLENSWKSQKSTVTILIICQLTGYLKNGFMHVDFFLPFAFIVYWRANHHISANYFVYKKH